MAVTSTFSLDHFSVLSIEPHQIAIVKNDQFVQMPFYNQTLWSHIEMRLKAIQDGKFITFPELQKLIGNVFSFGTLETLFTQNMANKRQNFLCRLLPDIARLAVSLPKLIDQPILLLKEQPVNGKIRVKFNRLQVASLLANAFFCTFSDRKSCTFNLINFALLHKNTNQIALEKFRCLLYYFETIISKKEYWKEEISFYRHAVSDKNWIQEIKQLGPCEVNLDSIEDGGIDMLHVDFANEFIGGGVLDRGCVQEEIRFMICPELIISCLLCEKMHSPEAIMIQGVRRYSCYKGYGSTFRWDPTAVWPQVNDVVAIDALCFKRQNDDIRWYQYDQFYLDRELRKAFSGFSVPSDCADINGIATGNWGGGVFEGDQQLKSLIQWMASSSAGRSLRYFAFNDHKFARELTMLAKSMLHKGITIAQLYNGILAYGDFFRGDKYPYQTSLFNYLRCVLVPDHNIQFDR